MVRVIRQALRIGITQRRIPASAHHPARDALDAAWSDWFCERWPRCRFLAVPNFADPSRAVRHVQEWGIDLLLFSGGEDVGTSPLRDAVEHALLAYARSAHLPVVGVCRGMQLLHVAAGGRLVRQPGHVAALHTVRCGVHEPVPLNSWHHWVPSGLMPGWTALAHAPDGNVEAMQHMHLPWLGMMWHPERPQGDVDAMWCWIENNIPTCEE